MKRFKIKPYKEVSEEFYEDVFSNKPSTSIKKTLYIDMRKDCLPYIMYKASFVLWLGGYSKLKLKEFNVLYLLLQEHEYLK